MYTTPTRRTNDKNLTSLSVPTSAKVPGASSRPLVITLVQRDKTGGGLGLHGVVVFVVGWL